MRFQVPQYIEVEDKLFGPLTFRQFIYIAGGVGLSAVIYFLLDSFIFSLIFIIPIMIFASLLAFYQFNNKPFVHLLEAFFYYTTGSKLFIWKKIPKKKKKLEEESREDIQEEINTPHITQSTLHELSLKLDMKEPEEKLSDKL